MCFTMLLEYCNVAILMYKLKLLLSGYVEKNLVPDNVEELLHQILSNQNDSAEDNKDIRTNKEIMEGN